VQNSLARRLATDPDPKNRNGSNAVLYAEKAVAATGRTNASYLDTLAAANAEAGQFAKAVNIQQQALALSQSEPEKRDLASRLELYSSAIPYHDDGLLAARTSNLLAAGRFAEAEPLARECLALCEKRIPDDWRTFNARSMLGGVLLGQKRFAEAEPLLLSGYQGMQQRRASIPTAGGTRLQEAIQRLVELYARTDRPELAVPLLAEASTANPEDTLLAMKVAASQAWLRQDADYAVTRQRMLNAGANATTAEAAERIARLACIRPLADPSQREAALALARKAVELGNGSPNFPWYQLALGIAKYRSGLYAEATAALTAVPGSFVANTWKPNQVEVAANFYRAMSLFKKGMPDEARAIFTATEAKMTPFPADDKIPLAGNAYYHDDLFLWLACKEAKALLNPPSAPQP
jgi:tetratricopeptide (TPR) repeat protein